MRILFHLLICAVALVHLNGLAKGDEQNADTDKSSSLRLVMSQRHQQTHLDEHNRDLLQVEDFLWGQAEGKQRRKKRGGRRNRDDDDSSSTKGSKSSKSGSSGSKGSKSSSDTDEDDGRYECKGGHCDDDDDDEKEEDRCGVNACCNVNVYEFVGQLGSLVSQQNSTADGMTTTPIENKQFASYVVDENVFLPDGEKDSQLVNPAVAATAKCLQVRQGRQCDGMPEICCEGLTMCDYHFSLSDEFGLLGDIMVSGGLTDNAVNVLPITGGVFGGFQKVYGEVVIEAVYENPADPTCPNISEVNLYNIEARIYVEECDYNIEFVPVRS